MIRKEQMDLYVDASKFSDGLREKLEKDGIVFHPTAISMRM